MQAGVLKDLEHKFVAHCSVMEAKSMVEAAEALNPEMTTEDMKSACEKAGTLGEEAKDLHSEAKNFLESKLREAKSTSMEAGITAQVNKLSDRLAKAKGDLGDRHVP